MDEIYDDLKTNLEQIYTALRRDLSRVRTGRASVNLLDGIKVEYYGSPTLISQVASIQVPEARMITIKPWEGSLLKEIERAIVHAGLGLNPDNDGTLIRLAIPPLTEERRNNLTKQVLQIGETAKISARNHRREANNLLKSYQKEGEITEDDLQRGLKEVQGYTDHSITTIEEILSKKQEELAEV
jgi:ribosome recycling factor